MPSPNTIPCPVFHIDAIERLIRDALRETLTPVSQAPDGALTGISQSWLVKDGHAERHASLGYWMTSETAGVQPTPFRGLKPAIQASAGIAAAHILDNIQARARVEPEVLDMGGGPGTSWIEALHTPDGILLIREGIDMKEVASAARRGRLPSHIRLLACPQKSQHGRLAASRQAEALLWAVSVRLTGRDIDASDPHLTAPML